MSMSRAKAKLAILHDLQCKQPDYIFTKKDCDLISDALLKTYKFEDIKGLFYCFKNLSIQR